MERCREDIPELSAEASEGVATNGGANKIRFAQEARISGGRNLGVL